MFDSISSPVMSDAEGSAPSPKRAVSGIDVEEMRSVFDEFDNDGSGVISCKELKQAMKQMGVDLSKDELKSMMTDSDIDGDGTLDFPEFIVMVNSLGGIDVAAPEQVSLVSINRVDAPVPTSPLAAEPDMRVFKRGDIEKEIGSRVLCLPEVELPPITDDRETDDKVELTRGKVSFVPRRVEMYWQWKDQGVGSCTGRVFLERWRTAVGEDEPELVASIELGGACGEGEPYSRRAQWTEVDLELEHTCNEHARKKGAGIRGDVEDIAQELLDGAWPNDVYRVCYIVGAGEDRELCIRNFQMTFREGCPVPVKDRVLADWCIANHGLGVPKLVGPSSRYVTETITDASKQWQEGTLLIPHEVFRFYHGMLLTIADNFPEPSDDTFEWKVKHFYAWYNKYYMPTVEHHHDIEERIIIPWIAEKVNVPDRVTAVHPDLLQRMEAIRRYESIMDSGASTTQVATFRKMIREFVVEMNDHISEEEAILPALIRQSVYTEADWILVLNQIVEDIGFVGNMTFLPAILYAAEAWAGNQADEMVPLPPAIETLYKTYWKAAWEKESLAVLYALAMEDEEPPLGCCINMCACPCQPDMNGAELECCYQTVACPVVTCSVFAMICSGLPCCSFLS